MDFTLNRTWPTFYDYIPVYKISIQYTNPFKRYRTETKSVTYGTYGQRWYYMRPHWKWRGIKKNLFATVLQDQDGPTPIYGKNPLKNFFRTKGLVALGCGMQHWGHGPNKVWKNDDIRVTLTFFIESLTFFYRKVIFFLHRLI